MTSADQRPPPSCTGITAAGELCRARPLTGRDVCWHHADDLEAQRAEARRRGGRHSATAARAYRGLPDPVREILDGLREVFAETRAGTIPPARAQAAASVGRAVLSAWDLAVVEDRLDEIEQLARSIETGRHLTVVR